MTRMAALITSSDVIVDFGGAARSPVGIFYPDNHCFCKFIDWGKACLMRFPENTHLNVNDYYG